MTWVMLKLSRNKIITGINGLTQLGHRKFLNMDNFLTSK